MEQAEAVVQNFSSKGYGVALLNQSEFEVAHSIPGRQNSL